MRKRARALFLSACLAASLALPAKAADTVLAVNAPDTLPGVGETFTVTVDISGNPGISAAQFSLGFDESVLDCTGVKLGTVLVGALSATNPDAKSGAMIAAASSDTLEEDGVLATFTFKVIGKGSPDFTLVEPYICQSGDEEIDVTVTGVDLQKPTKPAPAPEEEPEEEEDLPVAKEPEEEIPAEETDSVFTDTAGHKDELYINEAVERGYFQGYADGSFKPANPVTRGAFVTVLWRMAGRPEPTVTTPFTDIGHVNADYQKAIAWAYGKGYINGRTATTFAPGDSMSRQATMKILFHHYGGGSGMEAMFTGIYDDFFTDSATLNEQFKAPMYWGIYNGLIEGKTENTLGGPTVADRALLATVLVKYTDAFGAR